ncbi:hypothetical protein [Flammeovirga sp. SJP92]|uniref:hypothetical protein n=1 Tax=Flammeovirga sp. SJP92 TaxID=1775430 RepID=UPI000786C197|nr:hypothetical protein [Flammeovirga sp. SJP92]KXX71519.1 hypothetical protein AVL50_04410 [Flammeovirga sp. SJP92]
MGNFNWTSYCIGHIYDVNDSVVIEYSSIRPDVNRIKGMSNTPGGRLSLLFTIPFWVGLIWMIFNAVNGHKRYRLLKMGRFTNVKLIKKEPTVIEIEGSKVYKFTFSFLDQTGQKHQVTTMTSNPSKYIYLEKVTAVYDPHNPNKSFLINSLPESVARYINENWRKHFQLS